MRSLLWTATFRLFARTSRTPPPSASACCDQIAPNATSLISSSQSSTAPSQSRSQPFTSVPTAHVSNPNATVFSTSTDHPHCVHDASDSRSPKQSCGTKLNPSFQTNVRFTSAPPGGSEIVRLSSCNVTQRTDRRYGRYRPNEKQRVIEAKVSALLRGFCYGQTAVIGDVPIALSSGKVFVASPRVDVPPQCLHVCCEPRPEEWPVALVLTGLDWRESTVWLLRMQHTSESDTLQQLKAFEMISAPCSVNEKPRFLLKKKERHARCVEAHTPTVTPQYTPPRESEREWFLVSFELSVSSLSEAVRVALSDTCVRVVGNRSELGEWNAHYGMRLVNAEDILLAEVLVERGETKYKYVHMDGKGNILWEDGDNRRFACPGSFDDATDLRIASATYITSETVKTVKIFLDIDESHVADEVIRRVSSALMVVTLALRLVTLEAV
ncbi:Starch binding protein [Gracilaria domingensis]|nr:Starch binding protein [Gracilaria domingensis]